jgi:hypothetical protein
MVYAVVMLIDAFTSSFGATQWATAETAYAAGAYYARVHDPTFPAALLPHLRFPSMGSLRVLDIIYTMLEQTLFWIQRFDRAGSLPI